MFVYQNSSFSNARHGNGNVVQQFRYYCESSNQSVIEAVFVGKVMSVDEGTSNHSSLRVNSLAENERQE